MMIGNGSRIAELNDALRYSTCDHLITDGVRVKGQQFIEKALKALRDFNDFPPEPDPHNPRNEHDFGAMEVDGVKLYWKIDYFNSTYDFASAGPPNPAITNRVLTVMLACEY